MWSRVCSAASVGWESVMFDMWLLLGVKGGTFGGGCGLDHAELCEEQAPVVEELGIGAIPRVRGIDAEIDGEASLAHHEHPVGQADGLVDVVGDEQHRRLVDG